METQGTTEEDPIRSGQDQDRGNLRLFHIGEIPVADVLPFAGKGKNPKDFVVQGVTYSLRLTSIRYQVFQQSQTCAACGVIGTILMMDKHPWDKSPHFNLYHQRKDGSLVLMTKDHIVPKSHGGKNDLENLRTMCMPCNVWRANDARLTLDDIKERRKAL
jgi:hypothetical protein